MDSVADLVEPVKLEVRASIDNYKLGKQIAKSGGVQMNVSNPLKVTAKVTSPDGTVQQTELASVPGGLHWSCTCNTQQDFCVHVIATALVAWEKVPKQHHNAKSEG
jgi:hypothetical protein